MAERHGYGRQGQQPPARPAAPPASSLGTRPVPKPASSLPPTRPLAARVGEGRTLENGGSPVRSNGGNGHSSSGNGNGHGGSAAGNPSRSFDPDLDD